MMGQHVRQVDEGKVGFIIRFRVRARAGPRTGDRGQGTTGKASARIGGESTLGTTGGVESGACIRAGKRVGVEARIGVGYGVGAGKGQGARTGPVRRLRLGSGSRPGVRVASGRGKGGQDRVKGGDRGRETSGRA